MIREINMMAEIRNDAWKRKVYIIQYKLPSNHQWSQMGLQQKIYWRNIVDSRPAWVLQCPDDASSYPDQRHHSKSAA